MTVTTLLLTTAPPTGEIDPNTVKPGWVALLIILALAAATFLLWRNMSKQLKRIDFGPDGWQRGRGGAADGPESSPAGLAVAVASTVPGQGAGATADDDRPEADGAAPSNDASGSGSTAGESGGSGSSGGDGGSGSSGGDGGGGSSSS